jgi:hypothetical protein
MCCFWVLDRPIVVMATAATLLFELALDWLDGNENSNDESSVKVLANV